MSELTFPQEMIKTVTAGVIPALGVVLGGRWLIQKFRREREIEFAGFVRQKQYEAIQEIYSLFAEYMCLYRLINSSHLNLKDGACRLELLRRIASAEGRIDAAILRIASEFTYDKSHELKDYLADLRQSVQMWRESVGDGQELPFYSSGQADYVRFKTAFTQTCTYLASRVYQRLDQPKVLVDQATAVLSDVFDNKHEKHGAHV